MRVVIAFDVSDDKARNRVGQELLAHALRVQKSVFEAAELPEARFLRLRSKLEQMIDPRTDSVRYYQLCRACGRKIDHVGIGPHLLEEPETFRILAPFGPTALDDSGIIL